MTASLAFWLKEHGSEDQDTAKVSANECSAELHFNLWALDHKKRFASQRFTYLDIGVRLTFSEEKYFKRFETINVYVPFAQDDFSFNDRLAEKICNSNALISAVFNSPITNNAPNAIKGFTDITFAKENEARGIRFFRQLQNDSSGRDDGVSIEKADNGNATILSIPFSHFEFRKDFDTYVRFRLELKPRAQEAITYIHKPEGRAWLNTHEVTEIVDFRLNEVRNLPGSVTKHLQDTDYLRRIHFFLIRDSLSEHKISETAYKRCRLLERDLWGDYLNIDSDDKKKLLDNAMLIYHWAKIKADDKTSEPVGAGIDHFSAFSKFVSKRIKKRHITTVVLVALLISSISGLVANLVWSLFVSNP